MNCLRCGNEIPEGESFCASCLSDMEKDPIPMDAVVMVPKRIDGDRRPNRKPQLSSDEYIQILSKKLRRSRTWGLLLLVLLLIAIGCNVFQFLQRQKPAVGQNYSTVSSTSPTTGSLPTEG